MTLQRVQWQKKTKTNGDRNLVADRRGRIKHKSSIEKESSRWLTGNKYRSLRLRSGVLRIPESITTRRRTFRCWQLDWRVGKGNVSSLCRITQTQLSLWVSCNEDKVAVASFNWSHQLKSMPAHTTWSELLQTYAQGQVADGHSNQDEIHNRSFLTCVLVPTLSSFSSTEQCRLLCFLKLWWHKVFKKATFEQEYIRIKKRFSVHLFKLIITAGNQCMLMI